MNNFYRNSYGKSGQHRRHGWRRALKKFQLLLLLLGLLCLLIAGGIVLWWMFAGRETLGNKGLVLSAGYAGAGIVLLVLRAVARSLKEHAGTHEA